MIDAIIFSAIASAVVLLMFFGVWFDGRDD